MVARSIEQGLHCWSPNSPSYTLRKTAENNQGNFSSRILETLHNNFLTAVTEEVVVEVVDKLPMLLACGGFRLTKWFSSQNSVMWHVPTREWAWTLGLDLKRLPSDHLLTRLILCHLHGHAGSNQRLAAVHQEYWIITGPSTRAVFLPSVQTGNSLTGVVFSVRNSY